MIWISNRYDIDHAYLSASISSFNKDLIFSWNNTPVRLPHFYNNNTTFKSFFWVREKMFILTFSFEKHNKILRLTFSFMHKISYICMHISLCCFSPKKICTQSFGSMRMYFVVVTLFWNNKTGHSLRQALLLWLNIQMNVFFISNATQRKIILYCQPYRKTWLFIHTHTTLWKMLYPEEVLIRFLCTLEIVLSYIIQK